jgi:AbrB family looped-hinge helix DNA binding protein
VGVIVKVTRNYQITIPAPIRSRAGIREGDLVEVSFDEAEGVIKIVPVKRRRLTIRLGRRITVEEIEEAVEQLLDEATSP